MGISEIADFDKNGEVDTEEFMGGVETACKGKKYADLPEAFKFFIEAQFRTIDVDGDGSIGIEEFRYDCVSRMAYPDVKDLDAQFLGNPDESCLACNPFGPLPEL